jgi:hypothetical protein
MTTLRNTISELASSFASSVLDAIRGMSLEDIIDESDGARRGPGRPRMHVASALPASAPPSRARSSQKGGRLERRSQADIAAVVDRIVELLEQHPEGLRAEQIREMLELEAKELPRPIAEALQQRRITKSGQKRATTYFARGAAAPARGGRGGAAKGSGKRGGGAKRGGKRGRPAKGKRRGGRQSAADGEQPASEEVSSGEE